MPVDQRHACPPMPIDLVNAGIQIGDTNTSDSDQHLQQHRSFSNKLVTVRDNLRGGIPVFRDDLIGFLSKWLVNHILKTDKKPGAFIVAKRQAG